jgi:hypothetical protein
VLMIGESESGDIAAQSCAMTPPTLYARPRHRLPIWTSCSPSGRYEEIHTEGASRLVRGRTPRLACGARSASWSTREAIGECSRDAQCIEPERPAVCDGVR